MGFLLYLQGHKVHAFVWKAPVELLTPRTIHTGNCQMRGGSLIISWEATPALRNLSLESPRHLSFFQGSRFFSPISLPCLPFFSLHSPDSVLSRALISNGFELPLKYPSLLCRNARRIYNNSLNRI